MTTAANVVVMVLVAGILVDPGGLHSKLADWRTERSAARAIEDVWAQMVAEGGRIQGAAVKGPSIIVEFGDYECPYCRADHLAQEGVLAARTDVLVVYRHLPLSIHLSSEDAARASICAENMSAFRAMHDFLYESDAWLGAPDWQVIAREVGLRDVVGFDECLRSDATDARLGRDRLLAERLGIRGTPTYVGPKGVHVGALDAEAIASLIGN